MSSFTARAIIDSFLKIAAKKTVAKITVRDIVEDCAINRNTFYYHFKDIYDVMDAVLMGGCEEKDEDGDAQTGFFTRSLMSVLQFYADHRDVVRNICFSVGMERFSQPIKSYFAMSVREYLRLTAGDKKVAPDDFDMLVSFYSNGLIGMLCEWVSGGMKQDPRYIAVRIHQLLQGSAALVLENSVKHGVFRSEK